MTSSSTAFVRSIEFPFHFLTLKSQGTYDGYRFQCHIHRGIRFYTRRGYDWTDRLRRLAMALQPLSQHAAILDGEVVVETPDGRSDFHALEKEVKVVGGSGRLVYYVFDLLYYEAFDLRGAALLDRKRILAEVLKGIEGQVKFSEHIDADGPTVWRRACDLDLEGVVSKRARGALRQQPQPLLDQGHLPAPRYRAYSSGGRGRQRTAISLSRALSRGSGKHEIREKVEEHMALRGLPRERVLEW